MSYVPQFPSGVMTKVIREETSREVDDSPAIYNARDRNIHHREILAIEKFLVGCGWSATSIASGTDVGVANLLSSLMSILKTPMYQVSGIVVVPEGSNATIPLSQYPDMVRTTTIGALATTDVEINVVSTAGFPAEGWLTKFNTVSATTTGTGTSSSPEYKDYDFGAYAASISSQEVIHYSGTTATKFLDCTRDTATRQALPSTQAAVILCGKASLGLSPVAFNNAAGSAVRQFYVEHDAALKVSAALYKAATHLTPMGAISVLYDLTIVGPFGDIDLSPLVGAY